LSQQSYDLASIREEAAVAQLVDRGLLWELGTDQLCTNSSETADDDGEEQAGWDEEEVEWVL
jgi:hypothetical protein